MKIKVFFLPVETRPKSLPPLQKIEGKFWHAGIINEGKIYECFNFGHSSVDDLSDDRKKELVEQKAVFVDLDIGNVEKIYSEINSGTSCSEYVARVVGMSSNTGDIKEYLPEQVYDFLIH